MKPTYIITATILLLTSCTVVTPTSFSTLGSDSDDINITWGKTFQMTKARHAASYKATTKVVDNGIIAWAITNITNGIDDNATSIDKANIDASSKAASEKSANAAAKEANGHTEAMTELVPEPTVPTP